MINSQLFTAVSAIIGTFGGRSISLASLFILVDRSVDVLPGIFTSFWACEFCKLLEYLLLGLSELGKDHFCIYTSRTHRFRIPGDLKR